jgi:hypothetical protein
LNLALVDCTSGIVGEISGRSRTPPPPQGAHPPARSLTERRKHPPYSSQVLELEFGLPISISGSIPGFDSRNKGLHARLAFVPRKQAPVFVSLWGLSVGFAHEFRPWSSWDQACGISARRTYTSFRPAKRNCPAFAAQKGFSRHNRTRLGFSPELKQCAYFSNARDQAREGLSAMGLAIVSSMGRDGPCIFRFGVNGDKAALRIKLS